MDLTTAKKYLRVNASADDAFITSLIAAAIAYLEGQTGKTYAAATGVWDVAVQILVAHWYDNRVIETPGTVSKISHSLDALVNHIALNGDYS